MNQPEYPTPWQSKTIWSAVTALSIAVIFCITVGFIFTFSKVMAFLQPILVPFAIAGVLAYLLEPVVAWLVKKGTTRQRAVIAVFAITSVAFIGIMIWIIPVISKQTVRLARRVPDMTREVGKGVEKFAAAFQQRTGLQILPRDFFEPITPKPEASTPTEASQPVAEPTPSVTAPPPPSGETAALPANATTADAEKATPNATDSEADSEDVLHKISTVGTGEWINNALPAVIRGAWNFISASLGGFLGFFGFLLSLVIVPLYLFYFLTESPHIAKGWSKYLPLRASQFKDEVVAALTEINGYLIAFFRGQLVVSLINGVATGTLLAIAGLDFGILIGFALCFLGIIPYIGIILCWVPAVVIASVQNDPWLLPSDASWWVYPIIVTGIFTVVQQVDGLFITPKVVGERVGLHPVTVIFSVFLWSLLLGGLLGAILAVPLTATLKVLLKRYVWERTLLADAPVAAGYPVSEK